MFEKLKSKTAALALAPVALLASPVFAGSFSAAATEAVSEITSHIPDAVTIFGGMITFAVVVWAGRRAVGLFGR
ncbi:MAG: hypothetical protein ACK5NE_08065 [Brachymonas sp.]